MSYQAVVRDANDALVIGGPVGMRISVLQGSLQGTPVYVETHTATTNANGLATLEIGGGSVVSGTMAGIDRSTAPYFLRTEAAPQAAPLTPSTAEAGCSMCLTRCMRRTAVWAHKALQEHPAHKGLQDSPPAKWCARATPSCCIRAPTLTDPIKVRAAGA